MSDLDNFFAKKDKTRRKKKGVSNDDLEKKLDGKQIDRSKEKFKLSANLENFIQDEGEWDDFKDEENRDYSGLKIQTLTIKDKEEEQREEEELNKKEQTAVPWQKSEQEEEIVQEEIPEPKPEPKKAAPGELDAVVMSLIRSRLSRTQGPRIDDAQEFPDLGTSSETLQELKSFQTVKTGGPNRTNIGSQNESISTDNKFNALRNNAN